MKSNGLVLRLTVVMLTLVVGLKFSYAQDGGKFPYKSMVTGTNVYVRTAPDGDSPPVTKANTPQEVTVYSIDNDDWLAIGPVPGCYSVIAQKFVEVVGIDEKTGKEPLKNNPGQCRFGVGHHNHRPSMPSMEQLTDAIGQCDV